jgi:fructose/tagatose bisphosphate aldolase
MVPARKNGYAIGAFNVQNLESMSAIAEAATEEKSPIIIPEDQYRNHHIAWHRENQHRHRLAFSVYGNGTRSFG